jgi:exopolyphosphatase/guanosine-5'-triphosphate,3'-diphosphate pyrophosphatase
VVTIVPRWEWRTWGTSFGAAEEQLTALEPELVHESDELYLLSPDSNASVKVRASQMDVKRLVQVNADGLEQWRPVLKADFPLQPNDVRFVAETLDVPAPALERSAYALDEVTGLARTVPVHKRRVHYRIGGVLAEVSELNSGEASTRTLAVEGEDPAQVIATVRKLGLGDQPNVSVARGLKALLGIGTRCYAVIDVGTNSVKLYVAERSADGTWRTLADRSEVTRLGEGLHHSGQLGAEPVQRTVDAISALVAEARELGAEEFAAVGTAGLRIADNASTLIDAVRDRTGIEIEVIPGEEEARMAFVAATGILRVAAGGLVVFDTGGGSSQFTFGEAGRIVEQFSVNLGAVRLTESFGLDRAVPQDVVDAACATIAEELTRVAGRPAPGAVIGMGGAITNLAAVKHALATYDPDVVQGTVLYRDDIDSQIERYRVRPAEQRESIVGLQANRAAVILAGACIVRTVLTLLNADALIVSDRALRHGVMAARFGT